MENGPTNWIKKILKLDFLPNTQEICKKATEMLARLRDESGLSKIKPFAGGEIKTKEGLDSIKNELSKAQPDKSTDEPPETERPFELADKLIIEEGVKPTMAELVRDFPGTKFIGEIPGNGGRKAIIYVPQGFNPNEDAEMAYQLHGLYGQLARKGKELSGGNRLREVMGKVQEAQNEGKNMILVYPLSAGNRGSEGYDTEWMKKGNSTGDDMSLFDENVRKILANKIGLVNLNITKTRISGHSAGGAALRNILENGFKVDRVVFLDASYENWATVAYNAAIKNNPQVQFDVISILNTKTAPDAELLKDKPGVKFVAAKGRHGDMNKNYFNWG